MKSEKPTQRFPFFKPSFRSLFLLIIILAAIPRLILLDIIPLGVNFDEIDYIITAKSLFHNGTDLTAKWNPFSLTSIPNEQPKSEILAQLLTPFVGSPNFTLLQAHLPFAVIGILTVALIILIFSAIFSPTIGLLSGFVSAVNPLFIFSSRLSYDPPISSFFFLLGFAFLLYFSNWRLLLATLPFFLAFYSYVGAKLIFLPFITFALVISWLHQSRKFTKPFIGVFIISLIIFIHFVIRLNHLPVFDRSQGLLTPNRAEIIQQVNLERQENLLPSDSLINQLLINKYSITASILLSRLFKAISTDVLFTQGDTYHFFFVWGHGFFYFIESFLLLIGLYKLFKKPYNKKTWLLLCMLPFLTLPSLLSTTELSFAYRSYLLYLFLTPIIAMGIYQIISIKTQYSFPIVLAIYFSFLSIFMHNYLFRNPIYHVGQSQFTYRLMSQYLSFESKVKPVVIVSAAPKQAYQQHLLYSGFFDQLGDPVISQTISSSLDSNSFVWENLRFTSNCDQAQLTPDTTIIIRDDYYCQHLQDGDLKSYLAIARPSDSGQEFRIYEPSTCSNQTLNTYIRHTSLDSLNLKNLTLKEFCSNYIVSSAPN